MLASARPRRAAYASVCSDRLDLKEILSLIRNLLSTMVVECMKPKMHPRDYLVLPRSFPVGTAGPVVMVDSDYVEISHRKRKCYNLVSV
jgi:hypothetical protein